MAYFGDPILASDLIFYPGHSLIDQSLNSKLGATTTNGDGFGIGWYGPAGGPPGVYKSTQPAWSDANLLEVASHLRTGLLFAHVRASTGTEVQRTNCHPFRYGHWLWMHNGEIRGFRQLKRDLVLAIDPALYPDIEGSTDSEVLFFLALTFGLMEDPLEAVARAVGFVEHVGSRHGVVNPMQMTVATADGESIWAFRYSSEGRTRSLFYSSDVAELREVYPDMEILRNLGEETRLIVSEPLLELQGAWHEVPESSAGVVHLGDDELCSFRPLGPNSRR